jgi:hypothetical protein
LKTKEEEEEEEDDKVWGSCAKYYIYSTAGGTENLSFLRVPGRQELDIMRWGIDTQTQTHFSHKPNSYLTENMAFPLQIYFD